MKRFVKVFFSLFVALFVITGTVGVVLAATYKPNFKTLSDSNVPIKVFRQEKLLAVAQTLKTSTSNINTAKKDKSLAKLIKSSGLSHKNFKNDVDLNLLNDLEAKGYSHDKIIIAIEQSTIHKLQKQLDKLNHTNHSHKIAKSTKK